MEEKLKYLKDIQIMRMNHLRRMLEDSGNNKEYLKGQINELEHQIDLLNLATHENTKNN